MCRSYLTLFLIASMKCTYVIFRTFRRCGYKRHQITTSHSKLVYTMFTVFGPYRRLWTQYPPISDVSYLFNTRRHFLTTSMKCTLYPCTLIRMRLETTLISTTHPKLADTAFTVDGMDRRLWMQYKLILNLLHIYWQNRRIPYIWSILINDRSF